MTEPDLVALPLEPSRPVTAMHAGDRDRRFQLVCFALCGLAPEFRKTGVEESADDIGRRAVELADATLRALTP